jgi:hypothetical protein
MKKGSSMASSLRPNAEVAYLGDSIQMRVTEPKSIDSPSLSAFRTVAHMRPQSWLLAGAAEYSEERMMKLQHRYGLPKRKSAGDEAAIARKWQSVRARNCDVSYCNLLRRTASLA